MIILISDDIFDKLRLLHFESCTFGSWAEKFFHLSKNDKRDNPFEYYKKSVDSVKDSYENYKNSKMIPLDKFNKDHLYCLENKN